jgi:hypothetical protein
MGDREEKGEMLQKDRIVAIGKRTRCDDSTEGYNQERGESDVKEESI